jgi:uncharacterized membrane protein YqjE
MAGQDGTSGKRSGRDTNAGRSAGSRGDGDGDGKLSTTARSHRVPIDPNVGIPDLVGRLADDSKRLVTGELRLAKIEMHDGLKRGGQGAMWLGIALAVGVIGIVAFTTFVATLIGRVVSGHMWLGALIAAVIDLAIGWTLIRKGRTAFAEPSYSLAETRATLH